MISCSILRQNLVILEEQALEFHKEFEKLQPLTDVKELEQMDVIKKLFRQMTKEIKELKEILEPWLNLHRAEMIFGQDFLGPEAIKKAFGFEVKAPPIPFSKAELERAKELGQMLVLRVDKTTDGKPMSLQKINELLADKWEREGKGAVLKAEKKDWEYLISSDRWTSESVRPGWALVSKDLIPNSTSKNYIEQTEILIEYLKSDVFQGKTLPLKYQQAIQEFEAQKDELTALRVSVNWKDTARRLSELSITKFCRSTETEIIHDLALYYNQTNTHLLRNRLAWSGSRTRDDFLVVVGLFSTGGVNGTGHAPRVDNKHVGVLLSRRG